MGVYLSPGSKALTTGKMLNVYFKRMCIQTNSLPYVTGFPPKKNRLNQMPTRHSALLSGCWEFMASFSRRLKSSWEGQTHTREKVRHRSKTFTDNEYFRRWGENTVTTGLGLLKDKVEFELSQSTETQDSVKQRKGKRKKAIQEGVQCEQRCGDRTTQRTVGEQ